MKSAFRLEIFFPIIVSPDGKCRQFIVTSPEDLRKSLDLKIILQLRQIYDVRVTICQEPIVHNYFSKIKWSLSYFLIFNYVSLGFFG